MAKNLSLKLFLLAIVSISLIASAFAHHAIPLRNSSSLSLAKVESYRLPDGSLPSFCLGGNKSSNEILDDHCRFCKLAHSFDLPLTNQLAHREAYFAADLTIDTVGHFAGKIICPGPPVRGPPTIS